MSDHHNCVCCDASAILAQIDSEYSDDLRLLRRAGAIISLAPKSAEFTGLSAEAEAALYACLESPDAAVRKAALHVFEAARVWLVDPTDYVVRNDAASFWLILAVKSFIKRLDSDPDDSDARIASVLAKEIGPPVNLDAIWIRTGAHEYWATRDDARILDEMLISALSDCFPNSLGATLSDPRFWTKIVSTPHREFLEHALTRIAGLEIVEGIDFARGVDATSARTRRSLAKIKGFKEFRNACEWIQVD